MTTTTLKNGLEIALDTWDIQRMRSYVDGTDSPGAWLHRSFDGFNTFSVDLVDGLEGSDERLEPYSLATNLSPLEIQEDSTLPNSHYHRSIVALYEGEVKGVSVCSWTNYGELSWVYHLYFVEVHKEMRNLGIATAMLRELNEASFLKNKILSIGGYTPTGRKYARPLLHRELKARDYALQFEDFLQTPTKPGVYGRDDL